MYKVSETVLPIYINRQCPIIKTCSDVTLNLSSKDSTFYYASMNYKNMKNDKLVMAVYVIYMSRGSMRMVANSGDGFVRRRFIWRVAVPDSVTNNVKLTMYSFMVPYSFLQTYPEFFSSFYICRLLLSFWFFNN